MAKSAKTTYTARISDNGGQGRWVVEVVKHPFNAVVDVARFDYRDDAVTYVQETYPKATITA